MRESVHERGVTAREVVVAALVAATVVAAALQSVSDRSLRAGQVACADNVARINTAIEKWFFDRGTWPAADLSDLGSDETYFPGGIPRCPVTGKRYRMDPRTHRVVPCGHGAPARASQEVGDGR